MTAPNVSYRRGVIHFHAGLRRCVGRRAADRGGRPALGEMVQGPPRCASEIREFILATRHEKIILRAMRQWIATLLLIVGGSCWAADAIVKDGDTLILGDTSYKLDGIDAPEPDQVCLDEKGTIWRCGIEARDRLAKLIDSRTVRCDDKGPDPAYPARRIGVCWIDGQNLNQLLVRDGWAVNFEPYAKGRFKADESDAEKNRRGLWKGCFLAPHDFRHWNKQTAKLYGLTCSDDATSRNNLLPDHPAMPAGCPIKGNPKSGIYHTEGCRSYRSYENPKRWFCSEEEAQAAGFRKAKNCRTTYVGRASRAWA